MIEMTDTPKRTVVPYCSYGDYDNSTMVERSNHRTMLAQFSDELNAADTLEWAPAVEAPFTEADLDWFRRPLGGK